MSTLSSHWVILLFFPECSIVIFSTTFRYVFILPIPNRTALEEWYRTSVSTCATAALLAAMCRVCDCDTVTQRDRCYSTVGMVLHTLKCELRKGSILCNTLCKA